MRWGLKREGEKPSILVTLLSILIAALLSANLGISYILNTGFSSVSVRKWAERDCPGQNIEWNTSMDRFLFLSSAVFGIVIQIIPWHVANIVMRLKAHVLPATVAAAGKDTEIDTDIELPKSHNVSLCDRLSPDRWIAMVKKYLNKKSDRDWRESFVNFLSQLTYITAYGLFYLVQQVTIFKDIDVQYVSLSNSCTAEGARSGSFLDYVCSSMCDKSTAVCDAVQNVYPNFDAYSENLSKKSLSCDCSKSYMSQAEKARAAGLAAVVLVVTLWISMLWLSKKLPTYGHSSRPPGAAVGVAGLALSVCIVITALAYHSAEIFTSAKVKEYAARDCPGKVVKWNDAIEKLTFAAAMFSGAAVQAFTWLASEFKLLLSAYRAKTEISQLAVVA